MDDQLLEPNEESNLDVANDEGEGSDPLLSVEEIAREFGVSVETIGGLVASQQIRSLDRGLLAREMKFDVAVTRLSWADVVRRDSDAAGRRVDNQSEGELHPAVQVATDFHWAVSSRDGEAAIELCIPESTKGLDPSHFLSLIDSSTGREAFSEESGVASAAYSLAPIEAIAIRVVRDVQPIPRVFDKPTPVTLLAVIPMRECLGSWLVDIELLVHQESLREIVQSPLSEPELASPES